jgi:type VI secretion system protein ImpG
LVRFLTTWGATRRSLWSIQRPLRQIGIHGLCTNRHLPATLARGIGSTDFYPIDFSGPFADEIRFLVGPTLPGSLARFDASMWDLIRHLATNYLSFGEDGSRSAVQVLRRSLELHVDERRPSLKRQLEGLLSIDVQPTIRRVRTPGPMVFGRGVEIRVDFDEDTFGGSSPYLLGLILDEFFGRYVSINSFAVTVISTKQRGEFVRWPARSGDRMLV